MSNKKNIIEILEVSYLNSSSEQLRGFVIDAPKVNNQLDVYTITVRGWVLGKTSQVKAVWLTYQNAPNNPLKTATISLPRPDVGKHYSDVQNAENSGFSIFASVIGMPPEVNLGVQVILQDDSRVNVAKIRLRHKNLQSSYQPKLQPIMVNALGRSGSTWLMHLLAECPNIIVQRQYPYESYAAKYWLYMLFRFISDPTNYLNVEVPDAFFGLTTQWLNSQLHHNKSSREWFGRTYIEQALAFCQQSIDGFYEQVAKSQGQKDLVFDNSNSVFFAEKFGAGHPARFLYEIYPQAPEIFLVRDFRDVLCSSLSFSEKVGQFGNFSVQNKEDAIKITKTNARGFLQTWQRRSTQAHLVRYEDLILNPIHTLAGILGYLNIEHNQSIAERILKKASKNTPSVMQTQHRTASTPQESIGRWQRDLNDSMKALCEEQLADELKAFGYDV